VRAWAQGEEGARVITGSVRGYSGAQKRPSRVLWERSRKKGRSKRRSAKVIQVKTVERRSKKGRGRIWARSSEGGRKGALLRLGGRRKEPIQARKDVGCVAKKSSKSNVEVASNRSRYEIHRGKRVSLLKVNDEKCNQGERN